VSPLWRQWVRLRPAQVVLIEPGRNVSWTVEALTRHAQSFAGLLDGYRPGEKIAFRLPNGADWMALFLALQRVGLVAVPLDAALPAEGCLATARQIGVRALYVDGRIHPFKDASRAPSCCCIKVTSGSEGVPKTVACRAEHLLADGKQVIATMKIRPRDLNLAVIPLGHSYGLGNLVMPLIQQGTAMVTASEYVPRQLAEWIRRYRVTVLPVVPALLRVLAALPPGRELDSVRTVISAGAVLSPATAQAFFERYKLKVHNFYGSSETGGICYDRTGSASLTGRSVGRPLAGVSVTIRGGRVTVASPAVATRSGRWTLNDTAEWNARGELALLGRLGPEANIGGKKVHPREIERALRSLPGVTDAAVWLSQGQGRDWLVAAVESSVSRIDLERALSRQLPAWKLPKKYLIAPELPRTSRGKLDAVALRQQLA
jgi:acyl-CoA synthetase (AMP-forming)/AMP-acid ligase II